MPKINSSFFSGFSDDEDEVEEVKIPTEDEDTEDEVEDIEKEDDDTADSDSSDTTGDEVEEHDEVEDTTEDDDTDFFTNIINDQADKGVLFYNPDKEYEGSGEEIFDEVIEDTLAKKWEEEYVAAIPEEYHSLFTALKAGKSVTEWYENTQPTDYDKIDLSDEKTQKELIKDHLESTGMDDDDVNDKLQEYEDAGTLEKNSKLAVKYFKKQDDKKAEIYEKQLEEDEKRASEAQALELEKFKAEVLATEELGKKKLDKAERTKLLDHITKPVNKKGESQFVINQKSRDKQLQLAYLDMIGFDFSKLEAEATTKATSGLRAKLSKTTDINGKKNGSSGRVTTETNKIGGWNPW